MSDKEKRFDKINRLCDEAGIKFTDVIREAKVPYTTVKSWENKEPDAFETYDKLIDALTLLKADKLKNEQAQAENHL